MSEFRSETGDKAVYAQNNWHDILRPKVALRSQLPPRFLVFLLSYLLTYLGENDTTELSS